jgi:hypothetical protein
MKAFIIGRELTSKSRAGAFNSDVSADREGINIQSTNEESGGGL